MALGDARERSALIHREFLQIGALLLIAIAAFFVTRAVATSNRSMSVHDGDEWYRRGQDLIGAGNLAGATEAFRHAIVRDRNDKRYVLALSRALSLQRDYDAARAALLTLRESAPEDSEINLQLARLAAERQDVTEALRFYRNALYAPWSNEQNNERRQVRLELVRFLMAHDQLSRAQAELMALATDIPDTAARHMEVAQLFAQAGDHAHALDQFQHALVLAPDAPQALAGAGRAAFQLGNYPLARTLLSRTPIEFSDIGSIRETVELILSNDPLAPRLGSAERQRRFIADLSYAQQRLPACLALSGAHADDDARVLQSEAEDLAAQITPRTTLDQDAIETGMDLIDRIERHVSQHCGAPTAFDQALLLIGRQHGANAR